MKIANQNKRITRRGTREIKFIFQTITTLQGEDIVFLATDVTLPGAVDWVMMQSCFGSHFMLVLEKQEKFDGHVQFFAGKISFDFRRISNPVFL